MARPPLSPPFHAPKAGWLAVFLAGCGGSAPLSELPQVPPAQSAPCLVTATGAPRRDTIALAVPDPLLPLLLEEHLRDEGAGTHDCDGKPVAGVPPLRLGAGPVLTWGDDGRPALRVTGYGPAADPRDLIDRGYEIVVTSDPAALEYARRRGDLRLEPLAWARVHALVVPAGAAALLEPDSTLKAELASATIRAEARPAASSGWWDQDGDCPARAVARTPVRPGVAVASADPVARAIGERLLARAPSPRRRLLPLAAPAFDSALAAGTAEALIPALPRLRPPGCAGVPALAQGARIVPLVETHATAVLGPGSPAFLVRGDGTIRVLPPR